MPISSLLCLIPVLSEVMHAFKTDIAHRLRLDRWLEIVLWMVKVYTKNQRQEDLIAHETPNQSSHIMP